MTRDCWNVSVYVGEAIVISCQCTTSIFLYKSLVVQCWWWKHATSRRYYTLEGEAIELDEVAIGQQLRVRFFDARVARRWWQKMTGGCTISIPLVDYCSLRSQNFMRRVPSYDMYTIYLRVWVRVYCDCTTTRTISFYSSRRIVLFRPGFGLAWGGSGFVKPQAKAVNHGLALAWPGLGPGFPVLYY